MKRISTFLLLISLLFAKKNALSQVVQSKTDTAVSKNNFSIKEKETLGLDRVTSPFSPLPNNVKRAVEYDAKNRRYIVKTIIGDRYVTQIQYLTVEEYQRLLNSDIKRENWRSISSAEVNDYRNTGAIPEIQINSKSFEKIFGSNSINIQPRGEAELTFLGRVNKNENPLFNSQQRVQTNFDFNQRIQMDLVGNIGTKLKIKSNYNTEAQFDFENQIKLEYTGDPDEIIQKIEIGNVGLPLNTSLITGAQALFGVKTQLKFGRLNVTSVYTQQKSEAREIKITNGAQQNTFSISADSYEANRHYFLAHYFRNNYNNFLANAPVITSPIQVTKVEVWITNKAGTTTDSRDVMAFLDLGENQPYNAAQISGGTSNLPAGTTVTGFNQQSNNLLAQLPAGARLSSSNDIISFFQANGGTNNFAKLTYARKLTDREFTFQPQLGYISLNAALNADEVLAVAYRYTYNGVEYQVGEFSTDRAFDSANPNVLYTKLLKNETIKIALPTWDLMMKNIYSIGGYQISPNNFKLDIYRTDNATGVDSPVMTEGQNTMNKQWISLSEVDRLNTQNERRPDGVFDFVAVNNAFGAYSTSTTTANTISSLSALTSLINNTNTGYITIDPTNGRIIFPVVEPFGKDLASKFLPSEQALIDKYTFTALYDSTQLIARQLFPNQNRYVIKGNYQSEVSSEFSLNSINIPEGSVKVYSGTIPLTEGVDYTVDYQGGRVSIINQAVLISGQNIRITTENNELFGLQQKSLFGTRFDYQVNNKLTLGGTFMNLTEKPLTQKVNIGEEPISNTIWGFDVNYSSPSRFLTKLVDKIPLISTKAPSSVSFYGEFAQLIPGHPKALNFANSQNGVSYLDDFESSRSIIDLKSAIAWQLSGTPQMFSESQLIDDLAYGFNRAKIAFYNIDPTFYNSSSTITPANIRNNKDELSNNYVREVLEKEVFPYKEIATGQAQNITTLDVAYYPTLRGPYNYRSTALQADGRLMLPQNNWGGFQRKIETNDFESLNIGYIEFWVMDPFSYKPGSTGGDLYFNLGNISEDILKDGRKSLENGLPATDDPSKYDETNWGRVPKLQPVIQAFDTDPATRRAQDVGLDGLSDANERSKFSTQIAQIRSQLNATAAAALEADPSSDNYTYFRGPALDQMNAGILKRYQNYNGPEGNSKTAQQSQEELGLENSASTSLPDGEDINRDNNMTQSDEYFQYKVSMRPSDLIVGQNFITDKVTSQVKLANGNTQASTWYQFRIPIGDYSQKVGGIEDFKSIRFMRMFMTNFTDTAVLRFAKLQLVRGEWRPYNSTNASSEVIVDPALATLTPDNSTIDVSTVNIEENGTRTPIPYVTPPGIARERDYSNYSSNTQLNEQSLSVTVKTLKDGYGRAAFKTAYSDFRSYKKLEMYVHAEAVNNQLIYNNEVAAFLRIGTDNQDNYYEYNMPLQITTAGTRDPDAIWPEANRMNVDLTLFQNAKLARNEARLSNGQAWPTNLPFTYTDGTNTIIVKGQPDMSKVRVYMVGVKNPLRNAALEDDDGMDKSVLVWFNELRLTEFDERGGWAATGRLNLKLADFADVNISGSKSTIGFGALDSKMIERNRSDNASFDISSAVELGKFLPQKSGIKIPMYVSYSKQVITPQYNPRTPDIELKNALDKAANKSQRDSILNFSQDYTVRKGINFTNVHKERVNTSKPAQVWDIENFSASYAFTQYNHRDYINQSSVQNTYRASLQYSYSRESRNYAPFEKIIKSNMLALLKDININLMPSSLNFRMDVDRLYSENTLRNNELDASTSVYKNGYPTTYNKNFTMSRVYGVAWNLTRSLQLDFNATNYSIIDEPDGKIDGLKRDTVWQNLKNFGRTTDYNHNLNVSYKLPIDKIPGFNWVSVTTKYGTTFNWQTEPLATLTDPNINLGNTIQNTRTVQVNPMLNLMTLYNKFGFIRNSSNNQENRSFKDAIISVLTSIKNVNINLVQTKGIFLPGYLPKTKYLGLDNVTGAPGLGFVFGSQADIRQSALMNGWLTSDTLQTQLYVNTLREDLQFTSQVEPIRDLKITLKANRAQNRNFSSNFRYVTTSSSFDNLSATTSGDYSISYIAIGSAFKEKNSSMISSLFNQFMANRMVISRRLGARNGNSLGTSGGYSDGYGKDNQDVIVAAFLAAYSGKDASKVSLNSFPKIPLPNWNLTYSGLTKIPLIADRFSSVDLKHGYRSSYNINGYNTLIRYSERNGAVDARDANNNFLPEYQFSQVTLAEYFAPLIGIDTRFKNNLTISMELNRSRLLGLSLSNSQLAQLSENNIVFGLGYRTNKFRFPFGMFKSVKMDNNMDFKLDVAVRDNKTVIYRADVESAEVSSGAKNITLRPSVDYALNQKFNIKLYYDSNITKPYTSQSFNTSYSNFGFSLRFTLN
ncbi:cell surface protein SprA [Pedobacter sp. AW1-32]|uniref:T9SS outer membrane translocon Sov/SprA n=1 Tax=Pedobacter sp. AW1-32 TaxID=3383026 RepID=UPI003FF04309